MRFTLIFFLYVFALHYQTVRKLTPTLRHPLTYLLSPLACFQSPIASCSLPYLGALPSCLGFDTPHQAGRVATFSKWKYRCLAKYESQKTSNNFLGIYLY